jgi:predicted SnoaL-like aldol condensation-catalyzing enzyme
MDDDLKQIAIDFLRLASSGQVDAAYERHVAPGFRHHNAFFRGDADSLRAGMAENAAQFPDKTCEVKQALREGERVATLSHVRLRPGERGMAVVHIFRFQAGRIAELWDLGQPVPEEMANENGMF